MIAENGDKNASASTTFMLLSRIRRGPPWLIEESPEARVRQRLELVHKFWQHAVDTERSLNLALRRDPVCSKLNISCMVMNVPLHARYFVERRVSCCRP